MPQAIYIFASNYKWELPKNEVSIRYQVIAGPESPEPIMIHLPLKVANVLPPFLFTILY